MDRRSHWKRLALRIFASLLVCGASLQADKARAQSETNKKDASSTPAKDQGRADGGAPHADSKTGPAPKAEKAKPQVAAKAEEPRREPSEAYKESLRKTLERRRQRRARLSQAQGLDVERPVGAIVPWPMPPALIIRQTPEVHGEVDSLLGQLRRSMQ